MPAKGYGYLGSAVSWDFIYRADRDAFLYNSQEQTLSVFHKLYDDHLSQDEIAAHLEAVVSGQPAQTDVQFKKIQESSVVIIYAATGNQVLMYDVLSEDYWTQQGMDSFGTGLFAVCYGQGTSISDGEFIFSDLGVDSFALTASVGAFKIDSALLPDTALKLVTVNVLPDTGVENTIYLVRNYSGDNANYYDEYVWVPERQAFEKFGGIEIDLSDYVSRNEFNSTLYSYVTTSALNTRLNSYITTSTLNTRLNSYVAKSMITSGTAEYEDGVTNLETGKLYFQYEV